MAAVSQFVEIQSIRYFEAPNPSAKRSLMGHIVAFLEKANGAFRDLQLLERLSKAISMVLERMGNNLSLWFDAFAIKLNIAWTMLSIPRLPEVTQKAWRALTNWVAPALGPIPSASRVVHQKIHDVAEALATWGYSIALAFGNLSFKTAADVPQLVVDITDLSMAGQDYVLANQHLEILDANHPKDFPLRERFVNKATESFIQMIKSAASVLSAVAGLLVLALGGPILPAAFFLALGLTATIAAISKHFFKETREQESVDFFKPVEIKVI